MWPRSGGAVRSVASQFLNMPGEIHGKLWRSTDNQKFEMETGNATSTELVARCDAARTPAWYSDMRKRMRICCSLSLGWVLWNPFNTPLRDLRIRNSRLVNSQFQLQLDYRTIRRNTWSSRFYWKQSRDSCCKQIYRLLSSTSKTSQFSRSPYPNLGGR